MPNATAQAATASQRHGKATIDGRVTRGRFGLPEAALLVVTTIWGSTFIVIKSGLDGIGPFGFVGLRFGIAALVLAVAGIGDLRRSRWIDWRGALICGGWLFAGYGFQTTGLRLTSASKAGFITGLAIILVPVVGWIWFRHRPGWWFTSGAIVAVVGLGILTLRDSIVPEIGDLLVFGCAVAFAVHIVALGHYSTRSRTGVLIAGQTAVVGGLALAIAGVVEGPPLPANLPTALAIGYTALFATIGVLVIQTWAQRRISATRAAVIFAAEPIFAALFAVVAGERLREREILGAAIILVGMLLALREPEVTPIDRQRRGDGASP